MGSVLPGLRCCIGEPTPLAGRWNFIDFKRICTALVKEVVSCERSGVEYQWQKSERSLPGTKMCLAYNNGEVDPSVDKKAILTNYHELVLARSHDYSSRLLVYLWHLA
jgi:hypothetical protein